MSTPGDAEGQESVWARYEREDRENAKRMSRPNALLWAAFLIISLTNLAYTLDRSLPRAAFWGAVCIGLGLAVVASVLAYRTSRRKT